MSSFNIGAGICVALKLAHTLKLLVFLFSSDLISMLAIGLRKILTGQQQRLNVERILCLVPNSFVLLIVLCLFAAEDGKDHYTEESEVTTCETRADESFLLRKPSTRVKLEARTDSLKVPHLQ